MHHMESGFSDLQPNASHDNSVQLLVCSTLGPYMQAETYELEGKGDPLFIFELTEKLGDQVLVDESCARPC